MPRTGRRRVVTALKWSGLSVSGVLGVLWVASIWYSVSWIGFTDGSFLSVGIRDGAFGMSRIGTGPLYQGHIGWRLERSEAFTWMPRFDWFKSGFVVMLPLWTPIAVLAPVTGWLFWMGRRARPGRCPQCRYDRAGLPNSAPCPECGLLELPSAAD